MAVIKRYDINDEWLHTGIIQVSDFYYLSYCVGNIGDTIEKKSMVLLTIWNILIFGWFDVGKYN